MFKGVSRDKAPPHQNYLALPETIGKVDYF